MAGVEKKVSIDDLRKILMLDQVDTGNGMLFGTATAGKAEPRTDTLTLVIGIGGSGAAAVAEAVKLADQRFLPEYRNFVDFLVVDSDVYEIEKMRNNSNVRTLCTSTSGQIKWMVEHRSEFFRKFMPIDYAMLKLNYPGASADRMTGKIKLYGMAKDGCTTNDARFQEMIEQLFHGKWSVCKHLPVDIVILTSISGGTGSGTFMDLAARAKQVCRMAGVAAVKVYGYIMLPDTTEHFADLGERRAVSYQNGYAALKELESYMSVGFNRERKEVIASAGPIENVTIDWTNMLFDYPVLVSGDYKKAVSMIAETVVASVGRNSMSLNECLYGNLALARQRALSQVRMCRNGVLKRDACPEDSHQYCGIGYAYADIPEKIVISNVVGKVCRRMYANTDGGVAFCSRERRLTKLEFRDALNILFSGGDNQIPDENVLLRRIDNRLWDLFVLPQNLNVLTYADVMGMGNQYWEWEAAFCASKIVQRGREDIKRYLTELYGGFMWRAENVMIKYGPRAMEYLYTGEGAECSIQRIMESVKYYLMDVALTPVKRLELLPKRSALGMILVLAEKDQRAVDSWQQAKEDTIRAEIRQKIAEVMCDRDGLWVREYQSKVERFIQDCIRFADVLESMTEHYELAGRWLDADDFSAFAQIQMEHNGVNLCSDQQTYEWIQNCVLKKVQSVNSVAFRRMLVGDFMEHSELWCSDEKGVARKRYDKVMSMACQTGINGCENNGMDLSLGDYFNAALSDVPLGEQRKKIDQVVERIMEKLLQKSRPSLRLKSGNSGVMDKTVIVPEALIRGAYGQQILRSIKEYWYREYKYDPNIPTIISPAVDSIVCYQTSVANALSSLEDLPKWEAAYDRLPSNTKHLNCGEVATKYKELSMTERDELEHVVRQEKITPEDDLSGATGLSWEHYPSVNLLAYQGQFTGFDERLENLSEARYRQNIFEKKIEYALNEKIIECETVSPNVYQYWINLIPKDWDNLNVDDWMECEEGRYVRGEKLFEFLHRQNLHSSTAYRKRIVLTGSPLFESAFDFNAIIQLQHWDDARVEQEHRSYMKRIMRKNTALYMELEETLYHYYDIRMALEEKEKI